MAVTEAQKRASKKFNDNNYDETKIRVPKGYKEELKAISDKHGESLNGFINKAIEERIKRLKDGD